MLLLPEDVNRRSCGSFFLNPVLSETQYQKIAERGAVPPRFPAPTGVKVPAAWLIEQAGYPRGHRAGNVGLSTHHSLCLVAHAGANSSELLRFARLIRDAVLRKFGVALEPEPVLLADVW
jgi:UDP-N-acetylmuramate dehydrogenase